jgi:hypothetical protein|tara:strand:- start:9081 stop:9251 length:171 start_codon:yes stop_codon:yes gene_type:complete
MDEKLSVALVAEDIDLLLQVMDKLSCQGKAGAIQLLRIMNALETSLKSQTLSSKKE